VAYWLLKTEPSVYAFDDLVREKKGVWDGVRNALALKHLRAMQKGDLAFIYHSGSVKSIVGIAEVTSQPHPDPRQDNPSLVVVNLKPVQRLASPVTIAAIRARREFAGFTLIRFSRLSVMPVTDVQWRNLLQMSH
jgi:predicted RNA-binding protein with PUA-like domain